MAASPRCRSSLSSAPPGISTTGTRFLAAGYVFVAPTCRSRDVDPQSADVAEDGLAVVEHLRTRPFVDGRSVVVGGCSGGDNLALHVASHTSVCAVSTEEPATVLMSGVVNTSVAKRGERFSPQEGFF